MSDNNNIHFRAEVIIDEVLVHINGVASQTILPKVHSVSRISKLDVYGNPSKELQRVLAGTRTFNPFAGFSR